MFFHHARFAEIDRLKAANDYGSILDIVAMGKGKKVRRYAAEVIESISVVDCEKVIVLLQDEQDICIGENLISAIAKMREPIAARTLCEILLTAHTPDIRAIAAIYIGDLGCFDLLVIDSLTTALADAQGLVSISSGAALIKAGIKAESSLKQTLLGESALARATALHSLGEINGPKNLRIICGYLQDVHPFVRKAAAVTLKDMEKQAALAIPYLEKALEDSIPEVRQWVVMAIGSIGSRHDIKTVGLVKDDPDAVVRSAALWALRKLVGDT